MKDQVVMSKHNCCLAAVIPLYRLNSFELSDLPGWYIVSLYNHKPFAYLIDCGDYGNQLVNAEFAENNLEFLGDL